MRAFSPIFICCLIFAQPVFALTEMMTMEKTCVEQAKRVGNGEGKDDISTECVTLFKAKAKEFGIQKKTSKGEDVFAFKNLIFIESAEGLSAFSGQSTYLNDVQSMIVDEVHNEIIVLDKVSGILTFSSTLPGNVTPKRVIPASLLRSVSNIALDLRNEEIVVYSSVFKKAILFSRFANGRGKSNEQKLEIKKTIQNVSSYAPTSSKGDYAFYDEFGSLLSSGRP